MLQKTKSLLLKLLMLLCVACCAVALAFSLAGCSGVTVDRMEINDEGHLIVYYSDGSSADLGLVKGEDGQPGETPTVPDKFVVDFTIEGDTITIVFNDGKTQTITIDTGDDEACEHANLTTVVLTQNWDCSVGGQILEVCDDCGWTQIVDVPAGHVYESTVIAPTCMSEGYTIQTCIYCGETSGEKTDIVPATGEHVYDHENYRFEVAMPGSTLCEGGWVVYPCTYDCGYVEFEELAPKGHDVDEITLERAPSASEKGKATAFCNACGEKVVVELPQLTDANLSKYEYTITDTDVNCSEEMDAHFTYTDEKTGLTIEFDGKLPGGYHHLNGEAIDTSEVLEYTGVDSLPEGMELAGNNGQAPTCSSEGVYAVFTCDDCGRPIVVNIRVPHTKPANAVVKTDATDMSAQRLEDAKVEANRSNVYTFAASCDGEGTTGYEIYYCSVCQDSVKDVIPVPDHEWEYTATEGTEPGTNDPILTVKRDCKNCDATETFNLKDYTITKVEATCQEEGSITYTGTYEGESLTIVQVVPATPHVHAEYGELDDSKRYSVSDYPNIEISGNEPQGALCDESNGGVYGVFTCEDCGQPIVLNMYYPHTEPKVDGKVVEVESDSVENAQSSANSDHTKVYVVAPTCTVDGARVFFCDVCDKVVTVAVDKLGHDYKDSLVYNDAEKNWDYERKCANCDDIAAQENDIPAYDAETDPNGVRIIAQSASDCDSPATTTYQYTSTKTGAVVTVVVEGAKAMHSLNGQLIDDDLFYDPAVTEGIIPSGNYDLTCAGEGGLGVFTCDACGKPIVVHIRDSHTVPGKVSNTLPEGMQWDSVTVGEAEGEYEGATEGLAKDTYYTNAASCTEEGKYIYFCVKCQTWICGPTKATGHNFAYVGYTWNDDVNTLQFTLTFECRNANCNETAVIELSPFEKDGAKLTLNKAFTLVSFNAPTHNSYGNFTVKYTVTADDINGKLGAGSVADSFKYEVTLAGGLSRELVDNFHFHIADAPVAPVDPEEPDIWTGDGNYYWFVDTTAEDGTVTRTYYVATICDDCGEMYMVSVTPKTGDDIPESDLPSYDWAVKADEEAAAEEDTTGSEADAA